ncbi:hypothetical protein UlMin_007492 [Ulmus minor]
MSAGMREGLSNSRPPLLEGMNYLIWKIKMRSFLCSLDDDVWFSILEGYKIPVEETEGGSIQKPRSKWTTQEKRDSNMNSKALNALFCGVDDLNFRYIQNCKIAKEAWDKLEVAHEGTEGVKRSKLQMLTSQFESIRMEEGEKVADFNAKLIDITNRSCLLGEEYIESKIEEETEEENIQDLTAKLEEFEQESIEENEDYEESLEHSYQELFDQGLELIKEKKRLKGKIETLEISNNNLIDVAGNLKEENQKLSSESVELQQKLDVAYKELKEKIHELAIEKAEKHEIKESLKETQHAVSVLTLGAEKVTKMINFGKINDDKKGLGFDEDKPNERPFPKRFIPLSHQSRSKIVRSHNFTNYNIRTGVLTNQGMNKSFANQVGNKMNLQYLRKDRIKNQVEKALCVVESIDKSDWYFDSGCTKHMTGDIRNFYSLDDFGTGTIVYGNGEISNILGVGQVDITGLPSMDKVCYVDKLTVNLISISQLCDSGYKVLFDEYYCNIYDSNRKIVEQGYRTTCGLYRAKILEFDTYTNDSFVGMLFHVII